VYSTNNYAFVLDVVSENEFKIISTTFKKQAKNGQIQRKDFVKVMTKHGGMGEELANQLFDSFDMDNSGYEGQQSKVGPNGPSAARSGLLSLYHSQITLS
jgi:hypothetical protein